MVRRQKSENIKQDTDNKTTLYKAYQCAWSIVVVQLLSRVRLCNLMNCGTLGSLFTISWSLLKLMSIESVMPSSHLILCHPLLLLPSVFPVSGSFPMSQLFTGALNIIGTNKIEVKIGNESSETDKKICQSFVKSNYKGFPQI